MHKNKVLCTTEVMLKFIYETTDTIAPEVFSDLEGVLTTHIGTGNEQEATPCHPGDILVSLNVSGPLINELAGIARCSCGKALATITGNIDMQTYKLNIL